MSSTILRFVGIGFLIAAVVLVVLSFVRLPQLWLAFLPMVLIIFGSLLMKRARNLDLLVK
jgi:uncharacterized membrane protein